MQDVATFVRSIYSGSMCRILLRMFVQTAEKEKRKTRKRAVYKGEPIVIDTPSLDSYLGKPPFDSDRFYQVTPPGVVMGLAWTSMGGSTLYVESNKVSSSGVATLTITGACARCAQIVGA